MYSCLCCGADTLPVPPEEAVAFICPICWWENDVFTSSSDEPSDENHGLSLEQGRRNFKRFGISYPKLREDWARRAALDDAVSPSATELSGVLLGGALHRKQLYLPESSSTEPNT